MFKALSWITKGAQSLASGFEAADDAKTSISAENRTIGAEEDYQVAEADSMHAQLDIVNEDLDFSIASKSDEIQNVLEKLAESADSNESGFRKDTAQDELINKIERDTQEQWGTTYEALGRRAEKERASVRRVAGQNIAMSKERVQQSKERIKAFRKQSNPWTNAIKGLFS